MGKWNAANNTKMHLQPGNSDWTLSCVGMPNLTVGCVCVCVCVVTLAYGADEMKACYCLFIAYCV